MPPTIRTASAEDEPRIIALWQACGLVMPWNDPAADLRFARSGSNSDVLVATDEAGLITGSVMVGHDGHRGWLYYVAADPAWQGQGIGRAMVEAASRWLEERHVAKVQLMVRETNAKMAAFYAHLGFEETPCIVMAKWLKKEA